MRRIWRWDTHRHIHAISGHLIRRLEKDPFSQIRFAVTPGVTSPTFLLYTHINTINHTHTRNMTCNMRIAPLAWLTISLFLLVCPYLLVLPLLLLSSLHPASRPNSYPRHT